MPNVEAGYDQAGYKILRTSTILAFVSRRERAWSLYYGELEVETGFVIEYCKIQRNIDKTVIFSSFELIQGLYSMFGSVLQEIASGRQIDFIKLFKLARHIIPKGGIIATGDRILRSDLGLLRKQRQEINAAELLQSPIHS